MPFEAISQAAFCGQYLAKKNQNCPKHCISLNNISRGDYFFLRLKKWAIIRGRRLFQMLLTGSRTPNILFYYPIISKNYHIK